MPEIEVNGRTVQVDDSFLQMTPQQQNQVVNQIAQDLGVQPAQPAQPLAAPQQPEGSFLDPLLQGLTFGFGDEALAALRTPKRAIQAGLAGEDVNLGDIYTQERDILRGEAQQFAQENPILSPALEVAGGAISSIPAVLATGGAPSVAGLAGVGAAEGAIAGAGYSEGDTAEEVLEDVTTGAGIGGLFGAAGPVITRQAGRVLSSLVPEKFLQRAGEAIEGVLPSYDKAVKTLEDLGIPLTTGQKTGNEALKSFETTRAGTFGGGSLQGAFTGQRQEFNRKLLDLAGFDAQDVAAGELSEDAINRAQQAFGRRYDDALQGKTVKLDDDRFIEDLADIEDRFTSLLDFEQQQRVGQITKQIVDVADQPLDGTSYQRLRSNLGRLQRQTAANNPVNSALYGDIRSALDKAFERSTGDNLRTLNSQYGNFKQLEKVFQNTAGAKRGEIPLASLANRAAKSPGTREFRDLVYAANEVLPSRIPDSGTATRLSNLGAGNIGALGAGAIDPALGGTLLAGNLAANQALARGLGTGALTTAARFGQGLQTIAPLTGAPAVPAAVRAVPEFVSADVQPQPLTLGTPNGF